jgi:hypothetical protein
MAILGLMIFLLIASAIGTAILSHATNSWTGKGNNDQWSNPRNWSLGRPLNGQTLSFNLSKVNFKHYTFIKTTGVSGNGYGVALYDNIKNLSVKKLIFTATNANYNQQALVNPGSVGGDALTVTGQIVNDTNHNYYVSFSNQLNFNKNVLINSVQNGSGIYFDGTIDVGSSATVHLQTAKNFSYSDIQFTGPLTGNGAIFVNPGADVYFPGSSPKLSSSTTISYGAVVHLGETTTSAKGFVAPASVDGLGSSTINILNGGNLELDAMGEGDYGGGASTQFTVPNNITMTGSGTTYTLRSTIDALGSQGNSTGSITGAINSCIALGQEGCVGYLSGQGLNTVTFTGQVTLFGNTQIGVITQPLGGNQTSSMYSYTIYIFKKPVINIDKYSLTDVSNSQVQITD